MAYSDEQLSKIYDRTSGYCHVCGKKLAWSNYSNPGRRAAWEVEHSNPRVVGGTNKLGNLYPACILCNRSKGTVQSRTARSWYGRSKAPLSHTKRKQAKLLNAVIGAGLGLLFGHVVGGKDGAVVGTVVGAGLGHSVDPDAL